MQFTFTIQEKKNKAVINFSGSLLEQSQAIDLMDEVKVLLASGINDLLIDLQNLTNISNQGFDVLLIILTKARIAGGDMILTNVNEAITPILASGKLNNVFTLANSSKEVLPAVAL
jgi:anti-anti-sigma factor